MSKIKADRSKSVLPFLIPSMILMAALIVFLVCITGGTPSVYANLIVIPVVVTALYAPVWYSVIFAALSGFAMGPLVDLVTDRAPAAVISPAFRTQDPFSEASRKGWLVQVYRSFDEIGM